MDHSSTYTQNNFPLIEDCMIYVDSDNLERVLDHATASLECEAVEDGAFIACDGVEIRAAHNDYESSIEASSDKFLSWWTVIEITPPHEGLNERVREISEQMLTSLWKASLRAVAACNFERELPHQGGIGLY